MPFKKQMILSWESVPYHGLYGPGVVLPYKLKIRKVSWWGLRDRIVCEKHGIPIGVNAATLLNKKLNIWTDSNFKPIK